VKALCSDQSSRQTAFEQQALAQPSNLQRVFRGRQQRKKQEIQFGTGLKSRERKLVFRHVALR
jgi:hypothetical protein